MTALDCWYVPFLALVLSWHYIFLYQINLHYLVKTSALVFSFQSFITYNIVNNYLGTLIIKQALALMLD